LLGKKLHIGLLADAVLGNLICRRSRLSTSTIRSLFKTHHPVSTLSLWLTNLSSSYMTNTSLHTSSRPTSNPHINSSRCKHNNSIISHSQHHNNSLSMPDRPFRVRPRLQYNRGPEAKRSRHFRNRNRHSLGNNQINRLERGILPWASSLEGHRLVDRLVRKEHGPPVQGLDLAEVSRSNDA
jgi:hypothetical protein